jgi:hypothetical protein
MERLGALSKTAIGRALLEYVADMPLWSIANVALIASLLPALTALFYDRGVWAIPLSCPPLLVLSEMMGIASETTGGTKPRWRVVKARCAASLSLWAVVVLLAGMFLIVSSPMLLGMLVVLAVVVLMPLPFVLCIASLKVVSVDSAWRDAFVLAIRFPMIALGLLALALVFTWAVVVTKGALMLAVPALWAIIATYTTHELIRDVNELSG